MKTVGFAEIYDRDHNYMGRLKHPEISVPRLKVLIEVAEERIRQVEGEGFDLAHDDQWTTGHLAYAAASYALEAGSEANSGRGDCPVTGWAPESWPFDPSWWKPKDMRTSLVRAGALILAELERLDRLEDGHD